MQFFAAGANAESSSKDEEIQLEDAVHSRFRIVNTMVCGMCETVFKSVVNKIGDNSKKVNF